MAKIPLQAPKTPALERIKSVHHLSQEQGNFIEWLRAKKRLVLCEWTEPDDSSPQYLPSTISIEKLIAEYWEIDLETAENERIAILDYARALNG